MITRQAVYEACRARLGPGALAFDSEDFELRWYHAITGFRAGVRVSSTYELEATEAWWRAVPWSSTWPGRSKPSWAVVQRVEEWGGAPLPPGDLPTTVTALDAALKRAYEPRDGGAVAPAGVKGRGFYAEATVAEGEVFNVTRAVLMIPNAGIPASLRPYTLSWDADTVLIALGPLTLCNHSNDPNAVTIKGVEPDTGLPWCGLRARKAIAKDNEVTVSYDRRLVPEEAL